MSQSFLFILKYKIKFETDLETIIFCIEEIFVSNFVSNIY